MNKIVAITGATSLSGIIPDGGHWVPQGISANHRGGCITSLFFFSLLSPPPVEDYSPKLSFLFSLHDRTHLPDPAPPAQRSAECEPRVQPVGSSRKFIRSDIVGWYCGVPPRTDRQTDPVALQQSCSALNSASCAHALGCSCAPFFYHHGFLHMHGQECF